MESPTAADNQSDPLTAAPVRRSDADRRVPALLAHAVTALLAVILATLINRGLSALPTDQPVLYVTVTALPTAAAPAVATPAAPEPVSDVAQLQLDVRSLQADRDRLWSGLYLLRTAVLLDDALAALTVNDRAEADRALLGARQALDRAYQLGAEQVRDPIDQIRLQLARLRDDLDLRPEGADRRLRQLRRLVLSLVDEG